MSFLALQSRRTLLRHASHPSIRLWSAAPLTRCLSTTAKEDERFSHLMVDEKRLMKTLHETCEWGAAHRYGEGPTSTGMNRLALNKDDKLVRDWLAKEVESLGCELTVDEMGNMFAVRPGRKADKPPIMMGSHYDTQPTGGRYDGILGMTAGLEVLRVLHENNYETENPIGLINWTNEEGARFPMTTMGSSVWAGTVPVEQAHACHEVSSLSTTLPTLKTVKEELQAISYLGNTPSSHTSFPIAAHFELHIEQGPILENERLKLGVVTGGQAYSWYEITITGKDSHAGTTPMDGRNDPLVNAIKILNKARAVARSHDALITVGIMNVSPGSINTIPKSVTFTLDIRHPKAEKVQAVKGGVQKLLKRHMSWMQSKGMNGSYDWKTLTEYPAVTFDEGCIQAVEDSAEATLQGYVKNRVSRRGAAAAVEEKQKMEESEEEVVPRLWKRMLSGAGHDSCQTSRRVPTAMIFTPTRNGMSHTPDEFCSARDCALGAQALLGAVLRYDVRCEGLKMGGTTGSRVISESEEAKREEEEAERAEVVQGEDLKSVQEEDLRLRNESDLLFEAAEGREEQRKEDEAERAEVVQGEDLKSVQEEDLKSKSEGEGLKEQIESELDQLLRDAEEMDGKRK